MWVGQRTHARGRTVAGVHLSVEARNRAPAPARRARPLALAVHRHTARYVGQRLGQVGRAGPRSPRLSSVRAFHHVDGRGAGWQVWMARDSAVRVYPHYTHSCHGRTTHTQLSLSLSNTRSSPSQLIQVRGAGRSGITSQHFSAGPSLAQPRQRGRLHRPAAVLRQPLLSCFSVVAHRAGARPGSSRTAVAGNSPSVKDSSRHTKGRSQSHGNGQQRNPS